MLLTDDDIINLCMDKAGTGRVGMISPFSMQQNTQAQDGGKAISYGLSSVGYDIRISRTIKIFQPGPNTVVVDPKRFDEANLLRKFDIKTKYFELAPHGYVLGSSVERFEMPDTVSAICLSKSTYARCGILCNTTPLEPGWTGHLTLELANLTDLPVRIYVDEGIAQVQFWRHKRPHTTYADRAGKYMNQDNEPVVPRTL